jgi:hypothetical protein
VNSCVCVCVKCYCGFGLLLLMLDESRSSSRSRSVSSASSSSQLSGRDRKKTNTQSKSPLPDTKSLQISIPSLEKSSSTLRSSITESEILLSQSYFEDADRVVQEILSRSEETGTSKDAIHLLILNLLTNTLQ